VSQGHERDAGAVPLPNEILIFSMESAMERELLSTITILCGRFKIAQPAAN